MTKKQRIEELERKIVALESSVRNLENMVCSFMTTPHYDINYINPSYPATPNDPNFWQPKITC
jgi:hypothetical protein